MHFYLYENYVGAVTFRAKCLVIFLVNVKAKEFASSQNCMENLKFQISQFNPKLGSLRRQHFLLNLSFISTSERSQKWELQKAQN